MKSGKRMSAVAIVVMGASKAGMLAFFSSLRAGVAASRFPLSVLPGLWTGMAASGRIRRRKCTDRPRSWFRTGALLCALVVFGAGEQAAEAQDFDRGFVPYESYQGSGLDSVNLSNGNLLLHIPIISYPQRGSVPPFTLSLRYNNPRWSIGYNIAPDFETVYTAYWHHDGSSIVIARDNTYTATRYSYTDPNTEALLTFAAHAVDSSGAHHVLETTGDPTNWYSLRDSIDGSGLRVDTGNFTNGPGSMGYVPLVSPDGVTHEVPFVDPTIVPLITLENGFLDTTQDSNGNNITPQITNPGSTNYTVTGWVDTIGRFIPAPHQPLGSGWSPPSFCETLNFPAMNGGTVPMTFCYSRLTLQTPFPVVWAGFGGADNSTWLTSITLPNGTAWLFGYNSFGELSSITLPTGGVISYTWMNSAMCNGTLANFASYQTQNWHSDYPIVCDRIVATRTFNANDGSAPATWSYSVGYPNSVFTTVTDPAGNDTVHTFSFSYAYSAYETTTQYYSGPSSNNNLLKRMDRQYQNLSNSCGWAYDGQADGIVRGAAVLPLSTTTTWPNSQVNQTTFAYDSGATYSVADAAGTTHTCPLVYGSMVQESDYNYGPGGPGSLIRQTNTQYLWQTNGNYLNANLLNRVASVSVLNANSNQVANTTFGYDENNGSPQGILGNQTSITRWLNGATSPKSQTVYNSQGMPTQKIDPLNNSTTITYDSTGLFPTSTRLPDTSGIHHIDSYVYDANTGLLVSHTGQNGEITTYAYDNTRRLTGITYPSGGGAESYSYNDQTPSPSFTYTRQIDSSKNFVEMGVVDGLGRHTRTELLSDPAGVDYTDTSYDKLGRVASVSNPYRSTNDATYGLTTYQYDALGRATQVTKQDGGMTVLSYNGNCVTGTDEAGKSRKSCSDGLGRLSNVWEDPSGFNYETDYQYDALGNLTCAVQKGSDTSAFSSCGVAPPIWRPRSFTYDSLSRLVQANNPESGAIFYSYDANGNLLTKTDARNIVATYSYDVLNRITGKSLSDGTFGASYTYDQTGVWGPNETNTIGRLVLAYDGHYAASLFSYDALGRVTTQWDCPPSAFGVGCPTVQATYDLAGDLTQLVYPSGRTLNFGYNSAGWLDLIQFHLWNGWDFCAAWNICYNYWTASDQNFYPNGTPKSWTLGNGVVESTALNKRLQLQEETVANSAIGTFADHVYNYGTQNNGNILSAIDQLNSGRTQTFTYDALNRLATANESRWGLGFVYDPWGNNLQQNVTAGSAYGHQYTAATNNRLSGYSYDAAGNMLNDGFHNYIFDGEERISQVDNGSTKYAYDPDGQRVRKDVSNQPSIEYLYFGGEVLAEHNLTSGNWSDYIYANGHRIAKSDTFYDLLETQGTCNTPSQGCRSTFWFRNSGLVGYKIQSGDKLFIAQYNPSSTAVAGPGLSYRDANGNLTNGDTITNVFDQDGCAMNQDCASFAGKWHYRRMDLTPLAGMTVADDPLVETAYTTTSNTSWAVFYTYYSLVSTDGTIHPIFVGTMNGVTLNMSIWNQAGASGLSYNPYSYGCPVACLLQDTTYYHGDQIGSSRLLTVSGGWPVWQGTFLPYGEEYNPQITTNRYKFTGKERDAETQLDYFGARYYSNGLGRWISADWSATPVPVPYADLTDPQTLNLYGYVRGLPTTKADIDGHGFLDRLGNSLKFDGCWCEDDELEKHQREVEKKKQQELAEWRWQWIDSPWAKQWAKDHGGITPAEAMNGLYMSAAGAQIEFGYGPGPKASVPSEEEPVEVTISRSKSPAAAQHVDDAQAAGHPKVVTLDRSGAQGAARAAARGGAATRGTATAPGMDRDEYPPKCCVEGGAGSSVRRIPSSDNRSAGGQLGNQTRTLPDGTKVKIKTGP